MKRALALAIAATALAAGTASAQSFTVALDWNGGPIVILGQVEGTDALDLLGARVTPLAQVRAVTGADAEVALMAGTQVALVLPGQRWAMSGRLLWRIGWDGERVRSNPNIALVWTWRP